MRTRTNSTPIDGSAPTQRIFTNISFQLVCHSDLSCTKTLQFGAGYDSCPGQNIAKIELSKIDNIGTRLYHQSGLRGADMEVESISHSRASLVASPNHKMHVILESVSKISCVLFTMNRHT